MRGTVRALDARATIPARAERAPDSIPLPYFHLRDATVAFDGKVVLDGVTLEVAPGEALALVGPSGAGKTTLLRLLNGTLLPSRGRVEIAGECTSELDASALSRARSRVGFVHQDHALVPNLRVSQNVMAGRLGRGGFFGAVRRMLLPGRAELLEVHALLERVGIPDKLFDRTDTLSGGQQQRVAIARALHQGPEALLADEPLASVDPARARSLVQLLLSLARERGLALVASVHDLELAREFFPRMVGLRAGEVVFDAPSDELDAIAFRDLYRIEGAEPGDG